MPAPDDGLIVVLRAAQRGDRAATTRVLEHVLPAVRRLVHQRLQRSYRRNNEWIVSLFSTGDVVQDLLIGALRDLARFDGESAQSLMAWLSAQVEHRILERLRFFRSAKRDQRRVIDLAGDGDAIADTLADLRPSPSAASEAAEVWSAVQAALASLSDGERSVIEASLDPELSWADVALQLGLPTAEAARLRHRRAKARLSLRLAARYPHLFGRSAQDDHAG